MSSRACRVLRAFGRFWWDFLIGDTPELFVATAALVGLAFVLRHEPTAAAVCLPVLAAVALVGSARRAAGRCRRSAGPTSGPVE